MGPRKVIDFSDCSASFLLQGWEWELLSKLFTCGSWNWTSNLCFATPTNLKKSCSQNILRYALPALTASRAAFPGTAPSRDHATTNGKQRYLERLYVLLSPNYPEKNSSTQSQTLVRGQNCPGYASHWGRHMSPSAFQLNFQSQNPTCLLLS